MDHLSDLVSNTFPDSKITLANVWKQMQRNMLHCDELEVLRYTMFSLIIDESTDITSKKQFVIVVHFYCDRELKVRSRLFKLVEVTHGNADTITTAVLQSFEKRRRYH